MDTFNFIVAVLCAVGGFACVVWDRPRDAAILFVLAVLNLGLAVFTP